MNLRYLTFGCFGMIGLMILCGLAGIFLDAHLDLPGWMGQGVVALAILIAFLIFAIILGLRFRQSLHKHSRQQQPAIRWFSNLWLRKEK